MRLPWRRKPNWPRDGEVMVRLSHKPRPLLDIVTRVEYDLHHRRCHVTLESYIDVIDRHALITREQRIADVVAERDEWEHRYNELLAACGGVWPG